MLTLKLSTDIEFKSLEDLEAVIRQMPWSPEIVEAVLSGKEYIDTKDQAALTGAGQTVHKFKVEGRE